MSDAPVIHPSLPPALAWASLAAYLTCRCLPFPSHVAVFTLQELQHNVSVLHLRVMTLTDLLEEQEQAFADERATLRRECNALRATAASLQSQMDECVPEADAGISSDPLGGGSSPRCHDGASMTALTMRLRLAEAEADQLRHAKAALELRLPVSQPAPPVDQGTRLRQDELLAELAEMRVRAATERNKALALQERLSTSEAAHAAYRQEAQALHAASMARAADEISALHSLQAQLQGEVHRTQQGSPGSTKGGGVGGGVSAKGGGSGTGALERIRAVHSQKMRSLRNLHQQLDARLGSVVGSTGSNPITSPTTSPPPSSCSVAELQPLLASLGSASHAGDNGSQSSAPVAGVPSQLADLKSLNAQLDQALAAQG